MTPIEIAGLSVFILVLFIGIFSIIFGIPGTAIILIDVILYASITGFERIGIKIILLLIVMCVMAEAIDFWLGVAGAARFGISGRVIWISLVSGFIGAAALTPILFGLGTVAGSFLGGFASVLAVGIFEQSKLKPALRVGYRAILGRAAGMLLKGSFALAMIVITMSNVYS
ncbi:MAG TPA: DUF456 domain-containing protein [Syntrophales bacterium]|nr:DUF456 domain-containing protein [Syntrophales bacterium]